MTAPPGSSMLYQSGLFAEAPACDPTLAGLRRTDLGAGAWIDHLPEWIEGHEAVLEALWTTTRWQAQRRRMYDRVVDVPRLVATWPDDGIGHPLLAGDAGRARRALRAPAPAGRRSPPTAAARTASPSTATAWGRRAATRSWRSSRSARGGDSCCVPRAAGARARSTWARAICW